MSDFLCFDERLTHPKAIRVASCSICRKLLANPSGVRGGGWYHLGMHQLNLFTKRKAAKPKPISEMALHGMVADTLAVGLSPGWGWFHPANGGFRTVAEAGKFKRMGVRAGVSDIILYGPPHCTLHALELKRRGETPTEAQTLFMLKVNQAGGCATWADSYEAAVCILKAWGAVREGLAIGA